MGTRWLGDAGMTIATGGLNKVPGLLGGGGGAPGTPDMVGAARETSRGNLELEKYRTGANRFNEFNPYGSRTWTQNGDQWTSQTNLSPEQQALFNQEQQNAMTSGGFAGQALEGYDPNINWGGIRNNPIGVGQTAQDAIMARLQPQFDRGEEALRNRLANQGITLGSEAYGTEQGQFNQAKNDAYMQAALQGIGVDRNAMQDDLAREQFRLNQPLGLFQALQGQGQATVPQFAPGAQMGGVAGPDILGATNAAYQGQLSAYNAKQAQRGQLMGGLFGLGAASIMAPVGTFSDRRLKMNIQKIGTHPIGISRYKWNYLWGEAGIGVMADELESVMPEAVMDVGGFKAVDYRMIGGV